jgi:hypothetical protein
VLPLAARLFLWRQVGFAAESEEADRIDKQRGIGHAGEFVVRVHLQLRG